VFAQFVQSSAVLYGLNTLLSNPDSIASHRLVMSGYLAIGCHQQQHQLSVLDDCPGIWYTTHLLGIYHGSDSGQGALMPVALS